MLTIRVGRAFFPLLTLTPVTMKMEVTTIIAIEIVITTTIVIITTTTTTTRRTTALIKRMDGIK